MLLAGTTLCMAAALWGTDDSRLGIQLQAEEMMKSGGSITHDRKAETVEEKARWFRSLTLDERMDMLCAFTDLALSVNPTLQEHRRAQPVTGRIQVLSRA